MAIKEGYSEFLKPSLQKRCAASSIAGEEDLKPGGEGGHIMKKQMHIFGKRGVRGPSCSPWQEDKMAPFSPHFYWHKSHEINRIKLYWGV